MTAPVRVLVVDDSRTVRAHLRTILAADPDIEVVGEAGDGAAALELTKQLVPSVVVMDIEMPVMDGFEATKRIMVEKPTPIVIVSARHDLHQVEVGLRAMRAGALTVIAKPAGPGSEGYAASARRIVMLVKALADVKVVRQRRAATGLMPDQQQRPNPAQRRPSTPSPRRRTQSLEIVGVAASTGGPVALYRFLEAIPRTLAVPVLVVQHIADGFVDGLAVWLGSATVLPVCIADDGAPLEPGQVYLAPDAHHLEAAGGRVRLSTAAPDGGFRPSANALFASLAESYGPAAAGVVLTGMGRDGLGGATRLHQAGGLVLAQDADSSVVYGMPRAVIDAGLADTVGSVEHLASTIVRLAPKQGS